MKSSTIALNFFVAIPPITDVLGEVGVLAPEDERFGVELPCSPVECRRKEACLRSPVERRCSPVESRLRSEADRRLILDGAARRRRQPD